MARAGMSKWRSRNCGSIPDSNDEVQKSLDLLDKVLSEFDDIDSADNSLVSVERSQSAPTTAAWIKKCDNVSEDSNCSGLGGHQSEDDGYMSMNGRKAKIVGNSSSKSFDTCSDYQMSSSRFTPEFPPPPEEAERIISNLLPRVSPCNSAKKNTRKVDKEFLNSVALSIEENALDKFGKRVTTATQTTLPKTKHQRPYGWQKDTPRSHHKKAFPLTPSKFGSLPYDGTYPEDDTAPTWLPKHADQNKETKYSELRSLSHVTLNTVTEVTDDDPANFSDDSLEDIPPPPPPQTTPPMNTRGSIAWEVPFNFSDALLTPGSTKVVGRRRKKSDDFSSTSSLSAAQVSEDWPDPPEVTNKNSLLCLTSDTVANLGDTPRSKSSSCNGTYVIRRGSKKGRKLLTSVISSEDSYMQIPSASNGELKRCSSTFENIKTLLKEGLVEGLDDSPPDFHPPKPPNLVRVISLPNILSDNDQRWSKYVQNYDSEELTSSNEILDDKQSIAIQVSADFTLLNKQISENSCQTDTSELNSYTENVNAQVDTTQDAEDSSSIESNAETKIDSSIEDLLNFEKQPIKKQQLRLEIAKEELMNDMWHSVSEIPEVEKISISDRVTERLCNGVAERPQADFPVNVEILHHHEFGPLPPSPVQEVEEEIEENEEIGALELRATYSAYFETRRSESTGSLRRSMKVPEVPPHREHTSSLKTRSVDAGFTRHHRSQFFGSRKEVPVERRTLPTDLPATSYRRPYQKRSNYSPREDYITPHVSCSLPETPIFARGCDVPRTSIRSSSEIPSSLRATPRLNGVQTASSYVRNMGLGHGTSLGEAMAGAELLRMTGPGRGWYPRHRHPRPASVEHLDRLAPQSLSPNTPCVAAWEMRDTRKPLTLPPNLSPKFFQRSPREALRRVTSLLIRKGGSSKESKSKDVFSSSVIAPHGDYDESARQHKKGFFRSFWKKSRHYSLDQQ